MQPRILILSSPDRDAREGRAERVIVLYVSSEDQSVAFRRISNTITNIEKLDELNLLSVVEAVERHSVQASARGIRKSNL